MYTQGTEGCCEIMMFVESWEENEETLSIFKYPGQAFGQATSRQLSLEEFHATHTYILLNCSEVDPYNK